MNKVYHGVYIEAPTYETDDFNTMFINSNEVVVSTPYDPYTGEKNRIKTLNKKSVTPDCYIDFDENPIIRNLVPDRFFQITMGDKNLFLLNRTDSKFCQIIHNEGIYDLKLDNKEKLIRNFSEVYINYLTYYRDKYPGCDFKIKFGTILFSD